MVEKSQIKLDFFNIRSSGRSSTTVLGSSKGQQRMGKQTVRQYLPFLVTMFKSERQFQWRLALPNDLIAFEVFVNNTNLTFLSFLYKISKKVS